MQEQKDMTGVLFKNNRKQNDKQPDYTGKAMIEGYEYQLGAWIKTPAKGGDKFMSITFRSHEREDERRDTPAAVNGELDDDIPF